MKLDVNNSGAWKNVLFDFPAYRLDDVRDGVVLLAHAAGDRTTFRLTDNGKVTEYCDADGWRPSGHQG